MVNTTPDNTNGTGTETVLKTALVAMSGGVDSSVAAYLTQRQGYVCRGVTMKLFRNEDIGEDPYGTCCSYNDTEDARRVCEKLGMEHETLSYRTAFRDQVIERFIRAYERGETPNPCVDCNRYLKFGTLLKYAAENGFDKLVTGHYARIVFDEASGLYKLKKAADPSKDQSYVLYMLGQEQLKSLLFPLGEMTKTQARAVASERGFINAKKHDSQDICFVPDGDYVKFMENYTGRSYPPGDFIDMSGKIIGRHEGSVKYTPGQRRGLRLPMGERVYVVSKSAADNTVTVGGNSDLFRSVLIARDMSFVAGAMPDAPFKCEAKPRYRAPASPCAVTPVDERTVRIEFDEPQRALTPGQAVVLYNGDEVLGGGTISKTE